MFVRIYGNMLFIFSEISVLCGMNGPIYIKSKQLAIEGIRFCKFLKSKKETEIAKQLFRSITSVGANIHEAQSAESRNDFIHKLKIAQKELNESIYWTDIITAALEIPKPENLVSLSVECQKMLNKILSTAKQNSEK
jgi:four helix bundle protein